MSNFTKIIIKHNFVEGGDILDETVEQSFGPVCSFYQGPATIIPTGITRYNNIDPYTYICTDEQSQFVELFRRAFFCSSAYNQKQTMFVCVKIMLLIT